LDSISNACSISCLGGELAQPGTGPADRGAAGAMRGIAGLDLPTVHEPATRVEPYVRVDGTEVWSLMQLDRQLRPDAYSRVRGGYLARRRPRTTGPQSR
jgi:hypothetical protein